MPLDQFTQSSWKQGEVGPYLAGRADAPIYVEAADLVENWTVLPQGGITRRGGLEYVDTVSTTDAREVRLLRFDFRKTDQYLLVLTDKSMAIYRDKELAVTIPTPWAGEHLRDLRASQSGDSMFIVHEDYPPQLLERLGSHTAWAISEIEWDNISYFRHNLEQTLTPSATTGSITLTLSPADAYWKAGHDGVRIRVNPPTATATNHTYAEITGFQQNASGGTAYSSAGTAANAFDSNPATTCSAGATGWVGYGFGSAKTIRVIGIKPVSTATVDLVYETDDNSSFTSATNIITYNGLVLTADEWTYLDIPDHTGESHGRIRLTTGTLEVKDVVFNQGVVVTATVTGTLSGTGADKAWKEEAWSEATGYPRTVTFHQNRLVFGGTKTQPASFFMGKTGDNFNFDDWQTLDDNALTFTLSTDQVHVIRDIKSQRTLKVFTSDGEFEVKGGGEETITPASVLVLSQSSIGISKNPILEAEGDLIYITANLKEVRAFTYVLNDDRFVSDNYTLASHHLFDKGRFPLACAYIRSFRDTQSNMLFIPREDGEMAVQTINVGFKVNAWGRWWTEGSFVDAMTVATDHGDGYPIDSLFVVVERETGFFLECLTENKVFMDHWYVGSSETPKATWSGLRTLIGQTVQIVADEFVQTPQLVEGTAYSAAVSAGGTSYAVDDILTVVGGTGTAATLRVTAQTGGVVTAVAIETPGDYTVPPNNPVSVTGGAGTLATFNLTVGTFTLPEPVSDVVAGLAYDSTMRTMDLTVVSGGKISRGNRLMLKQATVKLYETLAMKLNGRALRLRRFGVDEFNQPLAEFSGDYEVKISGAGKNASVTVLVDEPLQATLLSLNVKYKVGL